MKIISISGLDGSGKSTQIEMLKNQLQKNGEKALYFHAVSFSIGSLLGSLQARRQGFYARQKNAVKSAGKLQILLRKIALIIDIIRFKKLYKKSSKSYNYILTDRYFYDQIVNILYLESKKSGANPLKTRKTPLWQKLAEKYIIKPNLAIYLQARPEIIMRREREVEQGRKYLERKKIIYDHFAKKWKLNIINGEKDKTAVFNEIFPLLNSI